MTNELPKDNLDLIPWVKEQNKKGEKYPLPKDHEFYSQYRERLEAEIEARRNG